MMRSLFSGVSGLKNHQTRMDVIGNNISNVNTTGFKSGRVTFTDMLSQTLTGASSPTANRGGTNPKQIGLGSSVSSIDTIFTDGSVQSTGKNTDLCLSGNGLFVVKDNSGVYYTRDGAFEFDSAGNYVLPGSGLYVQGWMANNGTLSTTGETTNICIPSGKSMSPETTTQATYTKNLNGSPESYTIANVEIHFADGTTKTIANYDPNQAYGDEYIQIETSTGVIYKIDPSLATTYTLGQSLTGTPLYYSSITSITSNANNDATLTYVPLPSQPQILKVVNGTSPLSQQSKAGTTYAINDPLKIEYTIIDQSQDIANNGTKTIVLQLQDIAGNQITVGIPEPAQSDMYHLGDSLTLDFQLTQIDASAGADVNLKDKDGTTHTETLTAGVTVTKPDQDGYLVKGTALDGTIAGLQHITEGTVSSVMINTVEGQSFEGLRGLSYSADANFYPSLVTTVTVYDSLGGGHDVTVLFNKRSDQEDTWTLSLPDGKNEYSFVESDGTTTTVSLDSTDLVFYTNGLCKSGSGVLTLSYGNGAENNQKVNLNLGGLTQYVGGNTISADADGHAAGTLASVSIDSSGVITGTYTNGVKQAEAQVAVAQFNNAAGLTKTGDSLYQESNNSGVPNIKTAADLGVTITPSALEMSNVDMANEFTDMIITQRGFQGNSKIITVSDEMLETLINIKR